MIQSLFGSLAIFLCVAFIISAATAQDDAPTANEGEVARVAPQKSSGLLKIGSAAATLSIEHRFSCFK